MLKKRRSTASGVYARTCTQKRSPGSHLPASRVVRTMSQTASSTVITIIPQPSARPAVERRSVVKAGDPANGHVHEVLDDLRLRPAADGQTVVALLDHVQRRRLQLAHRLRQEIWAGERVARSLQEEHRRRDAQELCVADALRLAGRVERISQKDQAGGGEAIGHNVRGDAPAHGATAEEETRRAFLYLLRHGTVARLETGLTIRDFAPGFGVGEVEAHRAQASASASAKCTSDGVCRLPPAPWASAR